MTLSQGRNLYSLLIKEIEKPLITLILKETHGNQIQAAQLLGMNRNTLRKKIKELKINFKRTKS
jgi:two-component system nitrogen regulation response regulator GlnG